MYATEMKRDHKYPSNEKKEDEYSPLLFFEVVTMEGCEEHVFSLCDCRN
mgnify:FL=1